MKYQSENLSFNERFGCIEVIENLKTLSMITNVANNALIFMLCGLNKKW
jgi:hypothetical protein